MRTLSILTLSASLWAAPIQAQENSLPQSVEAALPERPAPVATLEAQQAAAASHRFWDKQNLWLFAGVGAMRALDYHSTGNMRRRGRGEILLTNELVDNKPAFAAIQAGAVVTSIGLSYLFHRTNHHRLERWVSFLHIGIAGFGAVRNYCLETRRPISSP
jgi:hypothetical protein